MDFFQAQDNARKKSGKLVIYYIAAIVAIIITIYAVVIIGFGYMGRSQDDDYQYVSTVETLGWWQPDVFVGTAVAIIAVIGCGSLFKTMSLRSGGGVVARSVGGQLVPSNTTDPQRRRLVNVVEEMSIAAGVRMPEVYVLPEEGINAFAAGYSPDDAAIAVTQGALDTLTRDELQGVIAHEFSHILNGDMRLNIRLIGLLFGIMLLTIIGRVVIRVGFASGSSRRSSKDKGGSGAAIAILGLALIIVGWIGVVFGRLIQSAVSRQREFLADASAVQFTRNPDGISGALKKIGLASSGSRIQNAHATETSHMFFASALRSSFGGLFATHPPLVQRIKAIEPSFNGDFRASLAAKAQPPKLPDQPKRKTIPPPLPTAVAATTFLAAISTIDAPNPQLGADILQVIPASLREAAHDPERARAILLALLYASDNPAAAAKQDAVVAHTLSTTERMVFIEMLREIATMPSWARVPLADITMPALRQLQTPLVDALLKAIDEFIDADGDVSVYEYAMRQVIRRYLRPPGRPGIQTKTIDPLAADVALLLGALAYTGSSDPAEVQKAFDAGVASLEALKGKPDVKLLSADYTKVSDKIIKALVRIDTGTPAVKRDVLAALVAVAAADGQIQPAEQEMLRAVAAAWNCPAPIAV